MGFVSPFVLFQLEEQQRSEAEMKTFKALRITFIEMILSEASFTHFLIFQSLHALLI